MTLAEIKDKVAQEMGFKNWDDYNRGLFWQASTKELQQAIDNAIIYALQLN